MIIANFESTHKPAQLRASEALQAAGKLSTSLPPPTTSTSTYTPQNFLLPLFNSIAKGSITLRPALAALTSLVDYLPVEQVLSSLVTRLLDDLGLGDSANLRCNLIATILHQRWAASIADKQAKGVQPTQDDYDKIALEPLLPYFNPAKNAPSVWTHIVRYLLPACAKSSPDIYTNLLRLLGSSAMAQLRPGQPRISNPATAYSCWISVASLAVTSRHLLFSDILQDKIRDGLGHGDSEVRLKAFQLVTSSEDLLEPSCVELIKEGLRWNAVLPGAG